MRFTTQLFPGPGEAAKTKFATQVVPLATLKSVGFVPLKVTGAAVSVAASPPVLVTVTVIAGVLATPTRRLPKSAGDGLAMIAGATPLPDSETCCVLPTMAPESSVTVRVTGPYDRTVVGENVTIIVQLEFAPIARPFEHVVPCALVPIPKNDESAPEVMANAPLAARCRVSVPLFETVSDIVDVWLVA